MPVLCGYVIEVLEGADGWPGSAGVADGVVEEREGGGGEAEEADDGLRVHGGAGDGGEAVGSAE